jgi:uroporphyrin-3 C-methyltransferase
VSEETNDSEFDPFELSSDEPTPRAAAGRGLAWLAMLLALSAAAGSGYLLWKDVRMGGEVAGQTRTISRMDADQAALREAIADLDGRFVQPGQLPTAQQFGTLTRAVDELSARVAAMDDRVLEAQGQRQTLESAMFELQQQVGTLTETVAALTIMRDTPVERLDMLEVDSLLRLATERLQIFGNVSAADQALALADQRLADMDDPMYLPVRQRIERARRALAEVVMPDRVAWEGRVAALQRQVSGWPLRGEIDRNIPTVSDEDAVGIWARLKRTLSGLVTVRRTVADESDPLTAADQDYLRQGVWLQLEAARLAIMRSDPDAYQRSLARVGDTLESHFKLNVDSVKAAHEEVESLTTLELATELPDISAPWRQLRTLREAAQRTEPAAVEAARGDSSGPAEQRQNTSEDAGNEEGAG